MSKDMERLTEKLADGRNVLKDNYAYVTNPKHGSFIEGKAIDKLAEYEQAEEDGLLIKLPCRVGDTVYSVVKDGLQIFELKFSLDFYVRREKDFGKTVFTTKEKAEQALKQMGE